MSEEKTECNQTDKILKMICEVEKKYEDNFTKQAKLFKEIVPKAMSDDAKEKLKDQNFDERSFNDPFTFMLDFLGRGDEGRKEVAKALMGEENQDVLYLGVQNLTRTKFSHLKKTIDKVCNKGEENDIQGCLKETLGENDFEKLKKLFPTPTSTVTSVLYWLYPEEYIPFDANSKKLYEELKLKEVNENDWDSYNKVKDKLKKIYGFQANYGKFKPSIIIALSLVAWMNNNRIENILDKFIDSDGKKPNEKKPKNIILTGIPGTGKTHTVMEYLKNNEDRDKIGDYEFVQFHPSYDYEDFIEGLKPIPLNNGQIEFKLVNGIFKNLCQKAYDDKDNLYVMVIDEINRANLSRVFGELLYCLEYRDEFVSTKMTTYIESLEDEDAKTSYSFCDENIGKFAIPSNVIILGTMNEVDRSIDAFDLALRRRFIWEEMGFDSTALRLFHEFFEKDFISHIEDLIKKAEALNKKLSDEIGANYQLGHTYYFKIADYFDGDFASALCYLWEYHLKSIVREYCKVKYPESEIETKLTKYKKIIVDDKKCDG